MSQVGRWTLLEELARGAMGVVHRARDPASGREAALKLLYTTLETPELVRFGREVEALTRVRDPGLVSLLEAGVQGARPWLAMELVAGETLETRLRRDGPLPAEVARRIADRVARTLARLHAAGVLHRDLKPGNVLLRPDGEPVLLDLGLALLLDQEARLTRTGQVLGTPCYMAPEQAGSPRDASPACDVYGLGGLLYAMLSGVPPFQGDNPLEILTAVITTPPAPLPRGADRRLCALALRCLAKTPEARPPLLAVIAGLEPAVAGGRGTRAAAVAVAALTLGISIGAIAWRPTTPPVSAEKVAAAPDPTPVAPVPSPVASPEEAERAWAEALAAEERGDSEGTRRALERRVALRPDDAYAQFALGRVCQLLGDHPAALLALDRAVALGPDVPDGWFWRARSRHLLGDDRGALDDLEVYLRARPDHAEALLVSGIARRQLGDLAGAVRDLDRAIVAMPGSKAWEAWKHRGLTHELSGDLEQALADYGRAIELAPGEVGPWMVRANALSKAGRLDAALADFDRAVALAPQLAAALSGRGKVRLELGDAAGADEDFRRALVHWPRGLGGDEEIRRKQAEARARLERGE